MFKVSVVIPTYNRAALLDRAIESVLGQTFPVHEIVVSDDGSTDSTKAVLEGYANGKKHPIISVRHICQRQMGPSVARNTGIEQATGNWIAFLDSDDCWLPDKMDWQVRALQRFEGECGACVTDASYRNNSLLTKTAFEYAGVNHSDIIGVWPSAPQDIVCGHTGVHLPTLVVRSEIIRDMGGFDPSLRLSEDTDFFFRLACRTGICYVAKPLVEIDRTPKREVGLIELAKNEEFRLQIAQGLYEKWLQNDSEFGPDVRKPICHRLQQVHTGWASWHLLRGDNEKSLDALSRALNYHPTCKVASKWLLTRLMPGFARKIILAHRENAREAPLH